MEATKITAKINILRNFFGMIALAAAVAACDVFEDDPDAIGTGDSIDAKDVYVVAGAASVIDLNSVIETDVPVKVSVTSSPSKGRLTDLGNGLFQYRPTVANARIRDAFAFTVFSASGNQVLKKDSVIIHVEDDTTNLPCYIFPVEDHATMTGDSVWIDVLANDVICGTDSANLQLSIYKPSGSFPPFSGEAFVIDNRIFYRAGNTFAGADTILYKIQTATQVAYGFAYVKRIVNTCQFVLHRDSINVAMDTVTTAGVFLEVFNNDTWCERGPGSMDLSLLAVATGGEATINPWGIRYWPAALPQEIPVRMDTLRYNVCDNGNCRNALVIVKLKHQ